MVRLRDVWAMVVFLSLMAIAFSAIGLGSWQSAIFGVIDYLSFAGAITMMHYFKFHRLWA